MLRVVRSLLAWLGGVWVVCECCRPLAARCEPEGMAMECVVYGSTLVILVVTLGLIGLHAEDHEAHLDSRAYDARPWNSY